MLQPFNVPQGNNTKISRNHLTFAERVTLVDQMKQVLTKRPDGDFTYAKGWSDERVARDLLQGKASLLNVINVRKSFFGNLTRGPNKVRASNTNMARITKLELRIGKLEEQLGLFTQLLQMLRAQGKL
jgi:hypothetical protein